MNRTNDPKQSEMQRLLEQIAAGEAARQPVGELCAQAIACLERARSEFLEQALAEGYSRNDWRIGEIEIRQLSAMRQLARRGGLDEAPYGKMIREVQVRIFGEQMVRDNFDEPAPAEEA